MRTSSLWTRILVAFLAIALIPLAIVAYQDYEAFTQSLTQAAYLALYTSASQTALRVDEFTRSNLNVLGAEVQVPALGDYLQAERFRQNTLDQKRATLSLLAAFQQKNVVFISSCALLTLDGENVLDTQPANIGQDESARDYFHVALETGLPYVSPVEFSAQENKASLFFSSLVRNSAGAPVGVLREQYSASIIQQLVVQDTRLAGSDSYALIVDQNGMVLADGSLPAGVAADSLYRTVFSLTPAQIAEQQRQHRLPMRSVTELLLRFPELESGLRKLSTAEPYLTFHMGGSSVLYAASADRAEILGWNVIYLQPQEVFLAPVRQRSGGTLISILFITLFVGLVAVWVSRWLAAPIQQVTHAAIRLGDGNLNTRAPVQGNGEIGLLGKAFNDMADRLQETLVGLRESEANYRNIFESSVAGIYRTGVDGRFFTVNPAMAHFLGFTSPHEMMATLQNARQMYLHEGARDEMVAELMRVGRIVNWETILVRRDGTPLWMLINARMERNERNQPVWIEGFMTDITDRKIAEDQARHQLEELFLLHAIAIAGNESTTERELLERAAAILSNVEALEPLELHLLPAGTGRLIPIEDRQSRLTVFNALLRVYAPPETVITPEQHRLLETISGQISTAIDKIRFIEQAHRHVSRLNALHMIDTAINTSLDLTLTLNVILDQAMEHLRPDRANIVLMNGDFGQVGYSIGQGEEFDEADTADLTRLSNRVLTRQKPLMIADLNTPEQFGWDGAPPAGWVQAYFGLPIIAKGLAQGVLEVYYRQPFTPSTEWLNFFWSLVGQAAIAVDNTNLFNALQESNQELVRAYDATLVGWANALELRDQETQGHSRRVVGLTLRLARRAGLSETELVQVRRGALLHDIGKIGIPDKILQKPGKLSEEEWVMMRKHPIFAYDWLYPIAYLRPALDIPYSHHEKWDGSGYPRGLAGEQIPLMARIFAIVDVWDALISERCYHTPMRPEEARAYLLTQSGIHFDPSLLPLLLEILDEGEE